MLSFTVDFFRKLYYNINKMIFHTADTRKIMRDFFCMEDCQR